MRKTNKYITTDIGVRVRSEPYIALANEPPNILFQLEKDIILDGYPEITNTFDKHTWLYVKYKNKFGWIASDYIKLYTPTPTPTPTPQNNKFPVHAIKFGLHCNWNVKHEMILDFAEKTRGKNAGFVVLSDVKLANNLINAGHFVVYRPYVEVSQTYQTWWLNNKTEDEAKAIGRKFYHDSQEHSWIVQVNKKAVFKIVNECGYHPMDYAFWLGVMEEANKDGLKLAIFGDSYGTPQIAEWQTRIPAMQFAKTHEHFVTMNTYGVDDGKDYEWLGGRYIKVYDSIPDDARALIIFGEAGVNDGSYTDPEAITKLMVYSDKIAKDKYGDLVVLSAGWTTGLWMQCSLDSQIPYAIEELNRRPNPLM